MLKMNLIATCRFGLEAVLKREIYDLGYEIIRTEDGRVTFEGDAEAICRANIGLRTAQRVLLCVGEFTAVSFEELFEQTRAIPWEQYLPEDARFWVKKASVIKSRLKSVPDIQSVMKKAMVERMKTAYDRAHFEETGADYPVRVFFQKDRVTVGLDTSGESLHKRGYRLMHGKAPLEETLAAALVLLTPWRPGRLLMDPFCGSGTILIEASMIAARIAPGMNRKFTSCEWYNLIDRDIWKEAYREAREDAKEGKAAYKEQPCLLHGSDSDKNIIRVAIQNAKKAGVDDLIRFHILQAENLKDEEAYGQYGFVITNPPYGERMNTAEEVKTLYRSFGEVRKRLATWSFYIISSYEGLEQDFHAKAGKKRKLYNGMIRTNLYQYPGPRPPKQQ